LARLCSGTVGKQGVIPALVQMGVPTQLWVLGVSWVLPERLSPVLSSHPCPARGEQGVVYPTEFFWLCFNYPIPLGNVIQYMYDMSLFVFLD